METTAERTRSTVSAMSGGWNDCAALEVEGTVGMLVGGAGAVAAGVMAVGAATVAEA